MPGRYGRIEGESWIAGRVGMMMRMRVGAKDPMGWRGT